MRLPPIILRLRYCDFLGVAPRTRVRGAVVPDVKAFGEALDTIRSEKRKELLVTYWRGPTTGYEALNLRIGDSDTGESL